MTSRKNDSRAPGLCRRFVELAKAAFAKHPEIEHCWSIDADGEHCSLEIVGIGSPGFDITGEAYPDEVTIYAEGFHDHHMVTEPLDDYVHEILGRLRDMLSPAMRIREQLSNDRSFRWHLENLVDGQWHSESTCGLIFWNWFGRRSEKLFMNCNLPIRQHHQPSMT
jgi:hypothetical protein